MLVPEELAVTILINSRVGPAAFKSVQDRGIAASGVLDLEPAFVEEGDEQQDET